MKRTIILFILCSIVMCTGCDKEWFDMTPPEVSSIIPGNRTTGVSVRPEIRITFSKKMDTAKTEEAISIYTGSYEPKGYFRWEGKKVYYDLVEDLENAATCVIQVNDSAEDVNGNNILETVTSLFSVGTDFTPPSVGNISPADGTLLTDPYHPVVITFSEPVHEESLEKGFSVSPYVNGFKSLSAGGTLLTFIPYEKYLHATHYTITADTQITDMAGNQLVQKYTSTFTMGTDYIPPTLDPGQTDPHNPDVGAFVSFAGDTIRLDPYTVTNGADKNGRITLVFSESMTRMDTENAISLSPSLPLKYEWEFPRTLHLDVSGTSYKLDEVYTVAVSSGARDLQGNPIDTEYSFPFRINGVHSRYLEVVPFGDMDKYVSQVNWKDDASGPDDDKPVHPLYQDDTIDHGYSCIKTINTDFKDVYVFRVFLCNSTGNLDPGGIDELSAIQAVSFRTVTYWHNRTPVTPKIWKVTRPSEHPDAIDIYMFDIESETYYQFIIQGGTEGIHDTEGNYMPETFNLFVNS